MTPYVAMIPYPYRFQINPDEIAELIFVPLQALAEERRGEALGVTWEGQKVTGYYFYYQDYIIWGATARILKQFLDITSTTTDTDDTDTSARGSASSHNKDRKA